jgi:hypothetical protein
MRPFRPALFALFLATSLAAQTPGHRGSEAGGVTPRQTLAFDVAALVDERIRVALEPLVFGRFTVGLAGGYTRTANPPEYVNIYPVYRGGVDCNDIRNLCDASPLPPICIDFCGQYPGPEPKYRAWSLDLSVRYYPASLTLSGPRQRAMVYVGEFVGYHRRRVEQSYTYYGCPYCEYPPPADTMAMPPDSSTFAPPPVYFNRVVQNLHGWEPGVEIGIRLIPAGPVFIDVGGWFKLVTVEDPMQRLRPGDLDSRLVVAVGIGW